MHVVWLLGIPFQKIPGLTKDPGGVPLWVPLLTGSSFDGFLFTGGGGGRHILGWTCMLFGYLAFLSNKIQA